MLMNNKWINVILNSEVYSSFERVSPDHKIVSAKICPSLCRNKKNSQNHTLQLVIANRDTGNKYIVTVRNKFNTLQVTSEKRTLNDKYENFVTAQTKSQM